MAFRFHVWLIFFLQISYSSLASLYPFKIDVKLNQTYGLTINWNLDYQSQTAIFKIELEKDTADAAHWFGFGFSDIGEYEGSDLCVLSDNIITDSYVKDNGYINVDLQDDCSNPQVVQYPDGRVVMMFERAFDTCDPADYVISEGTTQLLVAMGLTNRKNINSVHVIKKIIPNRLIRSLSPPVPLPENTKKTVVRMHNVRVPAKETTYWCELVRLPKMTTKHHIVKYEAAVEPGNEPFVHHMEVFHCEHTPDQGRYVPHFSGPCDSDRMPALLKTCKHVIGAWAMGAEPFQYPAEAGIAIGGPGYFPFAMVEIHYNNPGRKQGVIDRSGIRIYYTSELRPYDAGILELGLIYSDTMAIPPGMTQFPLTGYCIPDCTDISLPEEGIMIFGSQLHSHLTGRKLKTVLVREEIEVAEVNRDYHYSPHWQEIRTLAEPVKVLPGDALITTCVHNTQNRNNVTLGGFGIHDEMCVNYIHYYPKSKLEVCKSAIDNSTLKQYFRHMRIYEKQPTNERASPTENYRSIQWKNDNIKQLFHLYQNSPLTVDCLRNIGDPFPGNWDFHPIPEIKKSLIEKQTKCVDEQ